MTLARPDLVESMRFCRHRAVRFLILFAIASLAIPNTAVRAVAPLQVTVSSQVTGFCDSPVWNVVTFQANVSGGVPSYTYHWDFGDGGSISTEAVPSHSYVSGGKYTANVTVTDSAGATASGSSAFLVAPPPCALRYRPLLQLPLDASVTLVLLAGVLTALLVLVARTHRRRVRP